MRLSSLFILFFAALSYPSFAQQSPVYSNYFTNPVLVNPAFTGSSGYTELSLNYRNQWTGIDGAPSTMNAILQIPVNNKLSFGMNLLADSRGALSSYESAIMTSYHLPVSSAVSVDFGLQLGVGRTNIDFNGADLAIDRALENSWYASGSFGMHMKLGKLSLAFALPELFENDILNESNFEELGLDVTEQTLTSVSYEFALSPLWSFEPFALYRTDREGSGQWEAAGIMTYKGFAWIGASYRQASGVGGLVGLSVNDWRQFSYAYDAGNETIGGFGNASHEVQLNIRIGKRNKRVNTKNLPLISQNTTNDASAPRSKEDSDTTAVISTETDQQISETEIAASERHEAIQEDPRVMHEAMQESVEESIASVNIDYERENELLGPDEVGMKPGFYVVVGAFQVPENAERYSKAVEKKGYTSAKGFSATTGFTYVYIMVTDSENQARQTTRSIKQINTLYFPEAWVLHVR